MDIASFKTTKAALASRMRRSIGSWVSTPTCTRPTQGVRAEARRLACARRPTSAGVSCHEGGGGGHLCCLKGVESEVEHALPLGELLMQLGQRDAALRRGARRRGRRDAHPLRRLHPVAKVEEVGLN